jgi:hypothetical protein
MHLSLASGKTELRCQYRNFEGRDTHDSTRKSLSACSDQELTWDVGEIGTNFRQRLQERNERYRSLESEYEIASSSVLGREYIARSIKLTVAKMTKNFHQDRSSDEQTPMPMTDDHISFRDALQFDKFIGPQMSQSYQFNFDHEDVRDSISHGSLIMKEIPKEVGRSQIAASLYVLTSPGISTQKPRTSYSIACYESQTHLCSRPSA